MIVCNEQAARYPVVVSFPHSGTAVPPEIRRRMRPGVVLPNTDWFLPELYAFLKDDGVTLLIAEESRYVVDLNRSPAGGFGGDYRGLVYGLTTQGSPIYTAPLEETDVQARVRRYYQPYYQKLDQLLAEKLRAFPRVLLLDMHSFFQNFTRAESGDVILSNHHGASSRKEILTALRGCLEGTGFVVTENTIKGGHLTAHFRGRFGPRLDSMQMELRYTAYLENRYFGEEEVTSYDVRLFSSAQQKLQAAFSSFWKRL